MAKHHWIATAIVLTLTGCSVEPPPHAEEADTVAQAPSPEPVVEAPVEPVSENCKGLVKVAEAKGLIRPGTASRDLAVLLTDARWATKMDGKMQEDVALCMSHYLAGGQNRWIRKLQFRNQATGVVYATVEGDRFRIGE